MKRAPFNRSWVLEARTRKFDLAGWEGYLIMQRFPDGSPAGVEVKIAKEGAIVSGLLRSVCSAVTIGLHHGVPLAAYLEEFEGQRFDPAGVVSTDAEVPMAHSLVDYIARRLRLAFPQHAAPALEEDAAEQPPLISQPDLLEEPTAAAVPSSSTVTAPAGVAAPPISPAASPTPPAAPDVQAAAWCARIEVASASAADVLWTELGLTFAGAPPARVLEAFYARWPERRPAPPEQT